jgi:hypothetical protein
MHLKVLYLASRERPMASPKNLLITRATKHMPFGHNRANMGIIMNIKLVMIARFGPYDVLLHWGWAFQSKSKDRLSLIPLTT